MKAHRFGRVIYEACAGDKPTREETSRSTVYNPGRNNVRKPRIRPSPVDSVTTTLPREQRGGIEIRCTGVDDQEILKVCCPG